MISIATIQAETAKHCGTPLKAMTQPTNASDRYDNNAKVAHARQLAMYLCRTLLPSDPKRNSYSLIGRNFGGRDHSTAVYACKRVQSRCEGNMKFAADIEELKASLAPARQRIVQDSLVAA